MEILDAKDFNMKVRADSHAAVNSLIPSICVAPLYGKGPHKQLYGQDFNLYRIITNAMLKMQIQGILLSSCAFYAQINL